MIAAAKAPAAIFEHAHPPPLGAIVGRQLLEPDDAMRDAVDGLVVLLGGQIVEHQHGRILPREIMLQRQDLPPVAQRALREQANFRQAVEHHAVGLVPLERVEDAPRRLAEFEVGRIEQALLLLVVEQAFGRDQLEDLDVLQVPAVRRRAGAQLVVGFGQGDVEPALSRRGAGDQELQRHRGLAGARAAFEQEDPSARQSAGKHVVEADDAGFGLFGLQDRQLNLQRRIPIVDQEGRESPVLRLFNLVQPLRCDRVALRPNKAG